MNKTCLSLAAALAVTPVPSSLAEDAWPGLRDADSYSFAANRLSFPGNVTTTSSAGLSHLMQVSPPYAVSGLRLLFANFYTPGDARPNPESCPGNPKTVDFATIFVAGNVYPVTFGSAVSARIGDCEFVWSDPVRDAAGQPLLLPAGTTYYIRSSQSVASGESLTTGMNYFTISPRFENWTTGSGVEYGSGSQTAKRLSGTVAAYSGGSMVIGPAMAIAKGWDGSPVFLVTGDSLAAAQNDVDYTGAGVTGYIARALDDAASTRRNFVVLAVPGTRPIDQASIATGQFRLRDRALRSIPNRPFNRIVTNMGNNSLALPPPKFRAAMKDYWSFLRGLGGPDTPIFQTTYGPRTGQASNSWYTSTAEQTSAGVIDDYETGYRWQAVRWLRSGKGLPPYVTTLDVTAAITDPADPSKFRPLPGAWTLTDAIGTGLGITTAIRVSGATAPGIGDHFVFEPGTANFERMQAYRVTGSGPWSVYFTGNTGKSHPAGATVLPAPTVDGLHIGTSANKMAAQALIDMKRNGVLQ